MGGKEWRSRDGVVVSTGGEDGWRVCDEVGVEAIFYFDMWIGTSQQVIHRHVYPSDHDVICFRMSD